MTPHSRRQRWRNKRERERENPSGDLNVGHQLHTWIYLFGKRNSSTTYLFWGSILVFFQGLYIWLYQFGSYDVHMSYMYIYIYIPLFIYLYIFLHLYITNMYIYIYREYVDIVLFTRFFLHKSLFFDGMFTRPRWMAWRLFITGAWSNRLKPPQLLVLLPRGESTEELARLRWGTCLVITQCSPMKNHIRYILDIHKNILIIGKTEQMV